MSVDLLLSRLERVASTTPHCWTACCPAHHDVHPSLSIRELEDGRVLVHCFGGCDVMAVLEAVELDFGALFPDHGLGQHFKPEQHPFPAADVLRCLAFEVTLVAVATSAAIAGEPLSSVDRQRLMLAVERFHAALAAGGIDHA